MAKKYQSFTYKNSFIQILSISLLLLLVLFTLQLLNSKKSVTPTSSSAAESATCVVNFSVPKECLVYAVQDNGEADSQFITIDSANNFVTQKLGSAYPYYNLESLDIHPVTGELYTAGSSGTGSKMNGKLFRVNKNDGSLTEVGNTGQQRIVALSFRPTDNTLWGWANGVGIIKIDINTAAVQVVLKNTSYQLQGAAWSNDGKYLYLSGGKTYARRLYRYDTTLTTPQLSLYATNLPSEVTEALEMAPDGTLLAGWHLNTTGRSIYAYDVNTKQPIPSRDINIPYNDIEGIAWPTSCIFR